MSASPVSIDVRDRTLSPVSLNNRKSRISVLTTLTDAQTGVPARTGFGWSDALRGARYLYRTRSERSGRCSTGHQRVASVRQEEKPVMSVRHSSFRIALLSLALTGRCVAAPPTTQTTSDPAVLRDAAIVAVNGLHESAVRATVERDTAAARVEDLSRTNTTLRDRVAQLEASTRPAAPTTKPTAVVKLGESIQAAIDNASAGEFIRIEPGVYTQGVKVDRAVTLYADVAGSVTLDGRDVLPFGLDITTGRVIGLRVTRFASDFESAKAAVRVRWKGKLEFCDVDENVGTGIGIPKGSHEALVNGCRSRRNGYSGISGTASNDVRILNTELRANNAGHVLNLSRAAADPKHFLTIEEGEVAKGIVSPGYGFNKFSQTNRLLVDGLVTLDNRGPGFWLDIDNRDYVIRNSTIGGGRRAKKGAHASLGLQLEINFGPGRVEGCTFVRGDAAALSICESVGVTVTGCTFQDTSLELRAMTVGNLDTRVVKGQSGQNAPIQIKDITITGNTFDRSKVQTSLGDWSIETAKDRNIVLDGNLYHVDAGATLVRWGKQSFTTIQDLKIGFGWETGTGQPQTPAKP